MNIEKVAKKLREAQFFLGKMREQEQRAFGDREPFDFYLSAFLNAAYTVDERLLREQETIYVARGVAWNKKVFCNWRKTWRGGLSPAENDLIKFIVKDRGDEVHDSGSSRSAATEDITVYDTYSDTSGTITISGSPGTPRGAIRKPMYVLTIAGTIGRPRKRAPSISGC
jgi:hypothetical protein